MPAASLLFQEFDVVPQRFTALQLVVLFNLHLPYANRDLLVDEEVFGYGAGLQDKAEVHPASELVADLPARHLREDKVSDVVFDGLRGLVHDVDVEELRALEHDVRKIVEALPPFAEHLVHAELPVVVVEPHGHVASLRLLRPGTPLRRGCRRQRPP